eukprot:TRINITY_DN13035_c0_g1_i2.p1 TRINITY_DN13035_c0_g1~~TRINITY_DN13035_c0_g1_i2.p1  ORF type:complete len:160 (-),score=25.60 TRINITY_DN13035_c0_g1_i2:78-557(-)
MNQHFTPVNNSMVSKVNKPNKISDYCSTRYSFNKQKKHLPLHFQSQSFVYPNHNKHLRRLTRLLRSMKNFHYAPRGVGSRPKSQSGLESSREELESRSLSGPAWRGDEGMHRVMNVRRIASSGKNRVKLTGDSYHSWIPLGTKQKKMIVKKTKRPKELA